MPIFEYRCDSCGEQFEKLVRNSDTVAVACPECGTSEVTTQLSTFAAHAQGSARGQSNSQPRMGGGCPAGMCGMPDVCGRN